MIAPNQEAFYRLKFVTECGWRLVDPEICDSERSWLQGESDMEEAVEAVDRLSLLT